MSKLFEAIRKLEKNPDGVGGDGPVNSFESSFEKGVNLSMQWPAELPAGDASPGRPGSRIMAIGIDAAMVLIALGLFVGVFFLSGGALAVAKDLPLLGSVLAILALFYWFLCLLANQGSPGMHFAGVRGDAHAGPADHGQLGLRQIAIAAAPTPPPLPRSKVPLTVAPPVRPTIEDLVTANKILANEKVLEAYGSISVRDERNSNRFFLARQVSVSMLSPADIVEYDLDGTPLSSDPFAAHAERFLHSEIYKARPDVMAIAHWRAADIIPFTASSVCLRPISQTAAFLDEGVPVFEIGKTDGGTGFTVRSRPIAQLLVETLGNKTAALLRGQGAVVVAPSLHGAVARAYYMNMNARLQMQAIQLGGEVNYIHAGEPRTVTPDEFEPAWEFWKQRLPVNGTHR